jgi:hypothetical protein
VDEDTHDEDKNKINNVDKGEAVVHYFWTNLIVAFPLTARFRQVKLFLAFGSAHR